MASRSDLVDSTIAGKYHVKRRIGAGGMGAVYEGEHLEIGKRVAIKVIEHEHAQSDELALRFKQEARAASAVESEHIVQVFDVGHDPVAGLYMVMEYLVGEDLSTYLERCGGKLPVEEAANIVLQAARGLAKAHRAGVVHRDLKPANLFLTKREDDTVCVKVVDFGISKLQRPDGGETATRPTLTRKGSVVGTPVYMSPEQAQGLKVDARTDVWSLGVLLYEALAGQPPFPELPTYEMMIIQIVTQRVTPLEGVAPWVSPELRGVVERALSHQLDERTPDAQTFARELAAAARLPAPPPTSSSKISLRDSDSSMNVHGATIPVPRPGPPTGTGVVVHASADPSQRRRRGALVAVGVLGIAALVVLGVAIAMGSGPKAPTSAGLVSATSDPASVASAPIAAVSSPSAIAVTTASGAGVASSAPAASSAAEATRPKASVGDPHGTRPGPPPAAPVKPGQYGAAGVSTSY